MRVDESVTFSTLLRRYRTAAGLSQQALADRAGLSRRGIADLERGARRRPHPATVFRLADALGLDADQRTLLALRLTGPVSADHVQTPWRTLPLQPNPLVGRELELRELSELLCVPEVRLVTLTGPGGVGKTRLAVAAAEQLAGSFTHGAQFVDLSAIRDPRLVAVTIAQSLQLRESGDRTTMDVLREHLRDQQLMLVVDNCEHVLAAAPALAELLAACPDMKILATSREWLRLRWERVFVVPPLAVPTSDIDLAPLRQVTSVVLFVQRAQAADPTFVLTEANAPAVSAICIELDGIPLAIELAAARVPGLPIQQIVERLRRRFDFLEGMLDAPPRQRSLRAAITWSYDLLSPLEQRVFRSLGVFVAGFSIEAAMSLFEGRVAVQVPDTLARLVNRSLLQHITVGDGQPRYHMLETIREFAVEQLASANDQHQMQQRAAEYFLDLAERADPELEGVHAQAWLERLDLEHQNLRATFAWAVSAGAEPEFGYRLGAALWKFWDMRAQITEGLDAFIMVLDREASRLSPARSAALSGGAYLALIRGEYARTGRWLEEALQLWRSIGDNRHLAEALFFVGLLGWAQADLDNAGSTLEQSFALATEHGPAWVTRMAPVRLADLAGWSGDYDAAERWLACGRDRAEAEHDLWSVRQVLRSQGHLQLRRGDVSSASRILLESLAIAEQIQDQRGIGQCLESLACAAAADGEPGLAVRLFGAGEATRRRLGTTVATALNYDLERGLQLARSSLRDDAFVQNWTDGLALTLQDAAALARCRAAHSD